MQVPKEGLTQKLQRLSASQQSIESVSSFCIFYHSDARGVVQVWDQEFYRANPERRLALLFLANHILQEGRKKGMGFQEEFFKVLPKALTFISRQGDDKIKKQAGRLVTVWEERRVFGTKHIKSFKDVMGSIGSAGNQRISKAAAGGSSAAAAAAGGAAAGPSSAAAAAAAADLGPVGEALANVNTCAAAAAAKSKEFNSSWSQGTLSTAGLPEVTAAHTQLNAFTTVLQDELTARQAAVTALTAEVARQNSEVSRLQSQLQSAGGQRQQLEQQMGTLTQQMTSAMASLGQFMQQQNGGSTAAATPPAVGSPQAPELLLEDDDDIDIDAAPAQPVLPQAAVTTSAAPPPGINGGPLGVFMPQPVQQEQQPLQQQQQPQPPAAQALSGLQALLGNPAMLAAAIVGGAAASTTAAPTSSAASGMSGGTGMFGGGDIAGFGGFGQMPGTFSAGFGLPTADLGVGGFADEGDDPYDPTLEG